MIELSARLVYFMYLFTSPTCARGTDQICIALSQLVAAVGRNVAKKRLGSSSSGADTPSPPLGPSTPAESPEPKQLVQEVCHKAPCLKMCSCHLGSMPSLITSLKSCRTFMQQCVNLAHSLQAVEAVEGPSVPSWHRLVALDLSAARVAEPEKEAEHLLWLAEKLTAVADASVRSAGSHLYITVSR